MHYNSLLWKIEGGPALGQSYLFGTMHVRDGRAFQRLENVHEAVLACEGFAAEFYLGPDGGAVDALSMQLPDNQVLSGLIPAKKYEKQRKILLKTTGVDIANFDRALPFVLVNLATERLLSQDMPDALDQYLWGFANAANKSLHGIETLQEQMEVLRKIPLESQLKMLSDTCRSISKFRHYLHLIAAHYEAGDIRQLYKMVKRNTKDLRPLMIYHRNEVMAERILGLAGQQTMFVAIGAAHLAGGKGVLRLLKKAGCKLSPMG